MTRALLWATAVVAVVALAAGCTASKRSGTRWEKDLYYTHRLHIDGQSALAAKRFETLQKRASNPADADEAAMMACEALRRDKAWSRAAACFDQLAIAAHTPNRRTRALLHAAQIRYDGIGERDLAMVMLAQLIRRAPQTPAGLRAIDWLTREGRRNHSTARKMIALMLRLERENPDSQLADNLLLRAAMLLRDFGTDDARRRAIIILERMARHHRHSSALLPGLILRARLHRHFAEPIPEARTLRAVVRTHETSHIFGTYIEPDHIHAMERLVELYAGLLRQPDRAEAMIGRLRSIGHRPKRIYAYLAALAALREGAGDFEGALSTWRELVETASDAAKDMRANDERICKESNDRHKRLDCLKKVRAFGPLPIKELPRARAAIARLSRRTGAGQ